MISDVSQTAQSGRPGRGGTQRLTEEQKTQLQDIISKYDPNTMTQEDHMTMRQELKDAGIRPSRELRQTLSAEGFTPSSGQRPTSPEGVEGRPNRGSRPEEAEFLADYLEKLTSGEATEEDEQTLLESVQSQGTIQQGLVVDELT